MIIIGLIGTMGWITGFYQNLDILGFVPISPVAAIAYILLGTVILTLIVPFKGKLPRLMVRFLIAFIMIIACSFWITAVFFPSIDIQNIVIVPLVGTSSAVDAEIAPLAAFAVFLGTISLFMKTHHVIKWRHIDTVIGILAAIILSLGSGSLIGYAFGDPHFYGHSIKAVSLSSSICLVLLGLGIISLNGTSKWPSSTFSSHTISAQMNRILIPIIVAAFLCFGWVIFKVIVPSSSDPVFAVGIFTMVSISAVALTVEFVSKRIQKEIEKAREERWEAKEKLAFANEKLEFLESLTRHDVLNLLSLSSIEAELAVKRTGDQKVKEDIGNILRINQTITESLKFAKEYKRIGIEEPQWQNVDKLISELVEQMDIGRITMDYFCEDWMIYADPMIAKAFFNLLENSIRHGEKATKLTVSCVVHRDDGTLRIIFSDNGIGIPQEEKERIFEKEVGRNTGLGLFFVRKILSITGISISENGIPGKGARFEIVVPKDRFKESAQSNDVGGIGDD
jgi:signal transduction histidine kinase